MFACGADAMRTTGHFEGWGFRGGPRLTALVALLQVAVPGLHRGALAVVVDAVAGAAALLDASPARHRTVGPL